MVGRLASANGRKDWTKYPTQIENNIAFNKLQTVSSAKKLQGIMPGSSLA